MSKFSDAVSKLKSEPVRAYVYSVLVVGVGVLVALGAVDGNVANYVEALGAVVLVVPAVETARAKVTPTPVGSPQSD